MLIMEVPSEQLSSSKQWAICHNVEDDNNFRDQGRRLYDCMELISDKGA